MIIGIAGVIGIINSIKSYKKQEEQESYTNATTALNEHLLENGLVEDSEQNVRAAAVTTKSFFNRNNESTNKPEKARLNSKESCELKTISIDSKRLKTLYEEFKAIGKDESCIGPGLHRSALGHYDTLGREWLINKMKEHGIEVYEDGACNIHGRWNWPKNTIKPTPECPAIVTGSHGDTVNGGGALDGALGAIAGLEAIVRLKELGVHMHFPIEVINFTDEEGRFGGMLGSMCLCGKLKAEDIQKMVASDGESAEDALNKHGKTIYSAQDAFYPKGSIHSYIELHIEQGPVLDNMNEKIGVVS